MFQAKDIPFLICDRPKPSGRIYPKDVMEKSVEEYKNLMAQKRSLGSMENDHPFDLMNVSHIVTDLYWDEKILMGTFETLSTPKGILLEDMLRCGISFSMTPVSSGEVVEMEDPRFTIVKECVIVGFNVKQKSPAYDQNQIN